jgi:tRNA dimethylallyltransferase
MTSKAEKQPLLLVVSGPTASGKTDFAIQLAQQLNTEILSADSRQIYREMTIGTAKPNQQQLNTVPHHFINHCSIHDPYNAGIFEREALSLLENLFKKHATVIVCGGTGLYIKALCEGLDKLPEANDELREELQQLLRLEGVTTLHKLLVQLDPEGSKTVDAANPHRLMRAIELVKATGKSLLELKLNNATTRPFRIQHIYMGIDRPELYSRINKRVDTMMEQGFEVEAKDLFPYKHLKALQTVGYNELFDYLEGKYSLDEAVNLIKQHTRNYAKRQVTWFKSIDSKIDYRNFKLDEIV